MFHLSRPISQQEKFECLEASCRCKLPVSPKKNKSDNKDDAISREWETVDHSVVEEPLNFGTVDRHLYRSSFPKPSNYRFLDGLKLRTIICLVDDEPLPAQYVDWTERSSINLVQIGMPGHKEAFRDGIPYELVGDALRLVVNHTNYPMLIHCNRGKHRTGTVVACLRILQKWHTTRALDEYARFSHPKERSTDQEFIEHFQLDELRLRVSHKRLLNGHVSASADTPSSPFSSMLNLTSAKA